MTFDLTFAGVTCDLYPRSIVSKIHKDSSKYVDLAINLIIWTSGGYWPLLTPRWHLTPLLLGSHMYPYTRTIVSMFHTYITKYVDFLKFSPLEFIDLKWHLYDLLPTFVRVTHVSLPNVYCVKVPWKSHKVYGYCDQLCLGLTILTTDSHTHTHTHTPTHTPPHTHTPHPHTTKVIHMTCAPLTHGTKMRFLQRPTHESLWALYKIIHETTKIHILKSYSNLKTHYKQQKYR